MVERVKGAKNILVGLVVLFSLGCSNNYIFEQTIPFADKSWPFDQKIEFKVNITDTIATYDCFIDLRHLNEYPYQNFWVFMETTAPDNQLYKDTLELKLSDPYGKWLGKTASGNLIAHHVLFQRNLALKKSGIYTFSFNNGMRDGDLKYLSDLGLSLKKSAN